MTDKAREEMSALMDGEASELEVHRVLKCCESDDELRTSWRRYHVARSVIRGEARDKTVLSTASLDITAAVSQAIAEEPTYTETSAGNATGGNKANPWIDKLLRPFGSVAVAASVSAMVIFGWQSAGGFNVQQPSTSVAAVAPLPYVSPSTQQVRSAQTNEANIAPVYVESRASGFNGRGNGYILADDSGQSARAGVLPSQEVIRLAIPRDDRFNRYILSHSGNAAFTTVSGAIPYARVVTLKPSGQGAK